MKLDVHVIIFLFLFNKNFLRLTQMVMNTVEDQKIIDIGEKI